MDERFMEQAAAQELLHRTAAIANASEPDPTERALRKFFDGVHCVEDSCGEEIPPARLALGKLRCIDCQTRKEKQRAH